MEMNSHQKVPTSQLVANSQPSSRRSARLAPAPAAMRPAAPATDLQCHHSGCPA